MSSIRIQPSVQTHNVVGVAEAGTSKAAKTRAINLFDASQLSQAPQSVSTQSGAISLPGMSQEDVGKMQSLFGGIDADKQDDINNAGQALGTELFKMLQQGGNQPAQIGISDDDEDGAIKPMKMNTNLVSPMSASKLATSSKLGTTGASKSSAPYTGVNEAAPNVSNATQQASAAYSAGNPNASYDNQVMAVTYMGVTNLQDQMTSYAQQVAARQKQQSALSADASELNTAISEWPAGTSSQTFTVHQVDDAGNITESQKTMTKEQAKVAADNAQSAASSMQDQSQTDMLRLQNMSQNYNNAISTISNLMKVSYDTVKNTIGNVHY